MPDPRSRGGRVLAVDAAALGLISVGICLASQRLALMSALVPCVVALRFLLWRRASPRASLGQEAVFFAVCTLLGAFNDWSSVVRHGVYDYAVPHFFPQATTIPLWMLLTWGLILRSLASLCGWGRLGERSRRDDVHFGPWSVRSAPLRLGLQLGLVLATRQLIYAHYRHPLLSWLPFAAALLAFALLFRPDRRARLLVAGLVCVGPLVEVLYIQVGGLHRYHLGWLGGVPLWIVLWWALGILVWDEVTGRFAPREAEGQGRLKGRRSGSARLTSCPSGWT